MISIIFVYLFTYFILYKYNKLLFSVLVFKLHITLYMTNLDSVLKSRHPFASESSYSQGYGPPCGHEQLWELDNKEGRTAKN